MLVAERVSPLECVEAFESNDSTPPMQHYENRFKWKLLTSDQRVFTN